MSLGPDPDIDDLVRDAYRRAIHTWQAALEQTTNEHARWTNAMADLCRLLLDPDAMSPAIVLGSLVDDLARAGADWHEAWDEVGLRFRLADWRMSREIREAHQ